MKKIILFGFGEYGEVAHFYFKKHSEKQIVAITAHAANITSDHVFGTPTVAFEDLSKEFPSSDYGMFIAIGYSGLNGVRKKIFCEAKEKGYRLVSFVSPDATCHASFIGENTFIFEDNTIQPFTHIGNNVVMWSGNHIGHHSRIGDHTFITSHVVVSGGVVVGERCFIGVNASIRDHVSIGERTIIGAGTRIMRNTEEGSVYSEPSSKKFSDDSASVRL